MKLITLQCPQCHGPLQVNSDLKQATCNYCGHAFLVDDETRYVKFTQEDSELIGKAAEKVRIETEERTLQETIAKIQEIKMNFRKYNSVHKELTELQKEIDEKQENQEQKNPYWNL